MKDFFKRILHWLKSSGENFVHMTADVIYDRRSGFRVSCYAALLKALSFIFGGIVRIRYAMYRKRILRDSPLGCLVVVVGNLTVGGTGKTPVVEKFARALLERGRKVAILSRGYKSKSESAPKKFIRWLTHGKPPPPKVVSDGKKILLDSEFAGDEPYMLASNLPGVVVIVDKNRVKAGHYAVTHFGADTLILDDGFQYLPLRGQMQLLLVDKTNPFGNMSMLPRGILREPVENLKRASFIFLTKSDGVPDPELERIIRRYNPSVEIIECSHVLKALVEFTEKKRESLEILKGKKVACFSGIAAPESFEKFLRDLGADLVYRKRFLDHHRFDDYELDRFFAKAVASKAELVVTTEKDVVRIRRDYKPIIPFYSTKLEIDILSGNADFDSAVSRICFPQRKSDK